MKTGIIRLRVSVSGGKVVVRNVRKETLALMQNIGINGFTVSYHDRKAEHKEMHFPNTCLSVMRVSLFDCLGNIVNVHLYLKGK